MKILIFWSIGLLSLVASSSSQNVSRVENRTTTMRTTTLVTSTNSVTSMTSTTASPPTEMPSRKPDYIIKGAGGNCLLFAGNVTFTLNYMASNGSNVTGEIQIPKNAKVTGNCTDFTNRLVFTWPVRNGGGRGNQVITPRTRNMTNITPTNGRNNFTGPLSPPRNGPGGGQAVANMITFLFIKKPNFAGGDTTGMMGTYSLTAVFGTVVADFPDATPGQVFRFQGAPDTKIEVDLQTPYKCEATQTDVIADATGTTHMSLSDVQIEAFRVNATKPEFTMGAETLCTADKLAYTLPIVAYVILGLAVLGAIAGIAYFKWRRSGYSEV